MYIYRQDGCDLLSPNPGSIRGEIEKGADPLLVYVMALRLAINTALIWDPTISRSNIVSLVEQVVSPSYLGGWGFPAFIDFVTKEKTDPMRPTNMYAQSLTEIKEGSETYKESITVLGAIYLALFRHPNVYSFTASLSIPAYKGVDDLRRILRNMVKCGDFCKEMVNAAEVICLGTQDHCYLACCYHHHDQRCHHQIGHHHYCHAQCSDESIWRESGIV